MSSPRDIFRQSRDNIQRLGLYEIPFTESPTLQGEKLNRIFTGREEELGKVFNLFQSRDRRRIMVSGRLGIGKSAFVLEVLSAISDELPEMLTAYISLPPELDLATTALIALAREMPEDEWAQHQLYQMGIPTEMVLKERGAEVGGSFGVSGKVTEKDLPITKPVYPTISLETLLERALEKYSKGVLIAIDDLDKQEPRRVRELMDNAQGMLKGSAWFILTAHPTAITGDWLSSERGLFDLQLPLDELDQPTTYQMLIRYLNTARIDNDCEDANDPRSVLPFLPETAKRFCEVSHGKPRLFNRLGNAILSKAAELQTEQITPEVLKHGLQAAQKTQSEQAALKLQEKRILDLLQQKNELSDETITIEDLEQLGVRSYSEIVPILERLEDFDLAHQLHREDETAYAPILLSAADEEENNES